MVQQCVNRACIGLLGLGYGRVRAMGTKELQGVLEAVLGTPEEQFQRWVKDRQEQHLLWQDWLKGDPSVVPRSLQFAVWIKEGEEQQQ